MCTLLSAADWRRHCLVLARERPPSSSFLVSRSHKSYYFFFIFLLRSFFYFSYFSSEPHRLWRRRRILCVGEVTVHARISYRNTFMLPRRVFFFLLIFIFFHPPPLLAPWRFIQQCPYKSGKVYVGSSGGIVPIRLAIFIYRHMWACVLAHAHSRRTEGFRARVSTCRKRIHNAWVLLDSSFAGIHSPFRRVSPNVAVDAGKTLGFFTLWLRIPSCLYILTYTHAHTQPTR